MPEPFEYAIKKDVRNNPIVREVDEARQKELWKLVGMAGVIVVVLLFFGWPHFELIRNGYEIEQLQRERNEQEALRRQLLLEVESLKSPKRIEALAIERLHLLSPSQGEAIVIERLVQTDPPAQSLVAQR